MATFPTNRRTILTLYDVLHLFALEGPRIRREVVVEYLERASGAHRRRRLPSSRLRHFERAKQNLRKLGAVLECVVDARANETWLVLHDLEGVRARLVGLLERRSA